MIMNLFDFRNENSFRDSVIATHFDVNLNQSSLPPTVFNVYIFHIVIACSTPALSNQFIQ